MIVLHGTKYRGTIYRSAIYSRGVRLIPYTERIKFPFKILQSAYQKFVSILSGFIWWVITDANKPFKIGGLHPPYLCPFFRILSVNVPLMFHGKNCISSEKESYHPPEKTCLLGAFLPVWWQIRDPLRLLRGRAVGRAGRTAEPPPKPPL